MKKKERKLKQATYAQTFADPSSRINCQSGPRRGHGPTLPSNRIRYFYENILRFDLLLKLNYKNIMQVPQISKIIILAAIKGPLPLRSISSGLRLPYSPISVSLALEIICGQKVFCTILPDSLGGGPPRSGVRGPAGNWRRGERARLPVKGAGGKATDRRRFDLPGIGGLPLLYCSLRARTMYNFLEKLISLRLTLLANPLGANNDYIDGQEVRLTLSNREVRLFPEIQNHFEFFESFPAVQIKLVTSASNERETRLLWTGLQQKEI